MSSKSLGRRITPHQRLPVGGVICSHFDRGPKYANWRPRGTDDWLLIYTHAGAGQVQLAEGKTYPLQAGSCLLYEPNAFQNYATARGSVRWAFYWAHFRPRPEWLPWLKWAPQSTRIRLAQVESPTSRTAVEHALRRMVSSRRREREASSELTRNALEEAILWIRKASVVGSVKHRDERVAKAMDYFATNLSEPFRLDGLARHCGVSASRLGHLFSAEFGMGPQRYGEELRLRYAQQLLRSSSLSVTEVAAETGFSDVFYFSRRFKRFAKVSPRAWANSL